MKISIKNLLFQPLALHLATDKGLHLSARECREILKEHVSEEIHRAAVRGLVSLVGSGDTDMAQMLTERAEESVVSPEPRKGKAK